MITGITPAVLAAALLARPPVSVVPVGTGTPGTAAAVTSVPVASVPMGTGTPGTGPAEANRAPAARGTGTPGTTAAEAHDFHVAYARLAVEPRTVTAVVRVFTDDLTTLLVKELNTPRLTLGTPEVHAALQRYLARAMPLRANGRLLAPRVLSSGEDKDMWWITVAWEAPAPITELRFHVAVLFDVFGDQQNIVKLLHVPSRTESSLYFAGGATDDRTLRFPR